jgi:Type IIA topoisomerase (DNA gyrase/topo II, topoisomerase IV), A subunit
LTEIINGTIACIKNPQIAVEKLMRHIPGPDFPTAGFINGREGILAAYKTGRGIIKMRARAIIEKNARNDRETIVITEIPYQVNKSTLIEKISELVRDKKVAGIADLRDESDREGIRVVIDLKRDENSAIILNQLYKFTQMESSFGIIMLAITDGRPQVLNIKEIIEKFIVFRREVVVRRTRFDLARAKERAHILEGLIIALKNIDAIVTLIKAAKNPQDAAVKLCEKFKLSEIQAKAILEMRLQRLTGLERAKIDEEYAEVNALMAKLEAILADEQKVLQVIIDELNEIKERYGDERRTEIVASTDDIDIEDMIVEEDMMVNITHSGYIKRNAVSLYKSQHRGGRGKVGMGTKEEDFVEKIFVASTHHYLLIFTSAGKVHWLKVYQIPQAGRAAKGKAIVNLVNLGPGERVSATLPVREFTADKFVVMVTKKGIIKKTELAAYANPRSGGIIAISIDKGDELVDVQLTTGNQDIFLATRLGMAIRFKEDDVRDTGRTARGVRGISLHEDDEVVGVDIPAQNTFMLTVSENGFGKCTPIEEYRVQSRGGKGTINLKTVAKVGNVSGVLQVSGEENIMLISNSGKVIRLKVQEVPVNHRVTQGVKLIELDTEEKLVGVARTTPEAEGKDDEADSNGEESPDIASEESSTEEE